MNAPESDSTAEVIGIAGRVSDRFNPITGGPAAPLKTESLFAAFAPSLMPRAAWHQGIAAGASVLAAEAVGRGVDAGIRRLVPGTSPFAVRIGARAFVAGVGLAVSQLPETDDEATARASIRTAGRLAAVGAIGGAIHETGMQLRERVPSKSGIRPIITGAAGFAGAMYYSKQLLTERETVIKRWTEDDKPANLASSIAIGMAVASVGRGLGKGYLASRRGFVTFFGEDTAHASIGRAANAAV